MTVVWIGAPIRKVAINLLRRVQAVIYLQIEPAFNVRRNSFPCGSILFLDQPGALFFATLGNLCWCKEKDRLRTRQINRCREFVPMTGTNRSGMLERVSQMVVKLRLHFGIARNVDVV